MVARLLMSQQPLVHSHVDDLESFLNVLSWVARGFMPHQLNPNKLTNCLKDVFEDSWEDETGPREEENTNGHFSPIAEFWKAEDPFTAFAIRYQKSPSEDELVKYQMQRMASK